MPGGGALGICIGMTATKEDNAVTYLDIFNLSSALIYARHWPLSGNVPKKGLTRILALKAGN